MAKLIARQVPPENQIWEWYNEDPDSIIIFGNEELLLHIAQGLTEI